MMTSNKLDFITKAIGGPGKVGNNFQTWLDCMQEVPEAWDFMELYNKRDILELERVYKHVRGWDTQHPNMNHYYNDGKIHCTSCGGTKFEQLDEAKYATTQVSKFVTFRCTQCGQCVRKRRSVSRVERVAVQHG